MDSHQLINQNSGNVEWFTPRPIVAVAKQLMGVITLDPACSAKAFDYQGEHSEAYYYEKGLSLMWWGNVWLNPPFGSMTLDWVYKLVCAYENGDVKQACCITFNSTETDWGQMLLQYPQFFFKRRVNYVSLDRDGNAKPSGSTKGSIFTYLPPKDKTDYFDYNLALVRLQNAMSEEGFKGVVK